MAIRVKQITVLNITTKVNVSTINNTIKTTVGTYVSYPDDCIPY